MRNKGQRQFTSSNRLRFVLLVLIGVFACAGLAKPALAQSVSVSFSSKRTWVGVPIRLTFSVENAKQIGDPILPKVDGLSIQYAGTVNQSTSISIINGVRRESRSVDLAIEITPDRPGTFTIPPVQIEVDGKPFTSQSTTFEAIQALNDGFVFAEIDGSGRPAYVGEPVALTLRIWIKPFHSDRHDITVPEGTMWQLVDLKRSRWGPFRESLEELARARQRPSGRTVMRDDGEYYLFEIKRELRPTGVGNIEDLSDVVIGVSYPTGVERSRSVFRSNLEFTGLMPIRARAEVENINVMPLPTEGRPEYFRGAVGEFVVRAAARPTDVAVGDPITLTFLVGNVDDEDSVLDTLRPPPLAEMSELTKDFRISKDPVAGTVEGNIKLFTQNLRPRWDTITEIPPIPFSFFDPDIGEYRTIHTAAIPIQVSRAEQLASSDIIRSNNEESFLRNSTPDNEKFEQEFDESLHANFPVSPSMLRTSSRTLGVSTPALLLVPPTFFAMIALVAARRRWKDTHPSCIRARTARRRALSALRNADSLPEIGLAVRGYVSDSTGRTATSVTSGEATRLARSAGADAPLLAAMEELLRRSERASYGIGQEDATNAGVEAVRLIHELDRCRWVQPEEVTL